MDNSLLQILGESQSILVLLPKTAYFDQVAASLALFLGFNGQKDVSVVSPTPMTVDMNRLIGVNKITSELGNKNLVIGFENYDGKNIERVSADLEEGKFYLTVIPKAGNSAPTKDSLTTEYSGLSADTVVLVGGANDSHFPYLEKKEFENVKLVHIGNRELATSKNVTSFVRNAPAVSEIVAETFILAAQSGQFNIEPDVATNLVMGIEDASKGFSSPETNADTFNIFATLLRLGGQRKPQDLDKSQFPEGSIPNAPLSMPKSQKPTEVTTEQPKQDNLPKGLEPNDKVAPKEWLKPKIFKGTDTGK